MDGFQKKFVTFVGEICVFKVYKARSWVAAFLVFLPYHQHKILKPRTRGKLDFEKN